MGELYGIYMKQNKTKQLERWVEHYSELYSRESIVHQSVLDAIDRLPQMPVLDEPPPLEELSKAIDKLPSGKAAGKDGIPAEVLKSGKSSLLVPLHKLLRNHECWLEGSVPQDMKDANIVTLLKNKGPTRLQQLSWYLSTQHCWQAVRPHEGGAEMR